RHRDPPRERPDRADRARRRHRRRPPGPARPHERGHRGRDVRPRPAEPRRGVPRPHRPARRGGPRRRRGRRRVPAHPRHRRRGPMTTTEQATAALDPGAVRGVLTRERPSAPGPLRTSMTFWWRALVKIKHVPEQLFDVTAFPIMFLLMFTYLFGGAVAGSTGAYLQLVLPGILVMTVTWITLYTGLGLNRDIQRGVTDRFKTLPIWRPSTIVGPLLADAVRYLIAAMIVLGLGMVLGFRPGAGALGVVQALALLLVFSFS